MLGPVENESSTSTQTNPLEELRKFQSEKQVSRSINLLAWWKDIEQFYLGLLKVSRNILSIPSTSTLSERVFSVPGLTLSKLRSNLSS